MDTYRKQQPGRLTPRKEYTVDVDGLLLRALPNELFDFLKECLTQCLRDTFTTQSGDISVYDFGNDGKVKLYAGEYSHHGIMINELADFRKMFLFDKQVEIIIHVADHFFTLHREKVLTIWACAENLFFFKELLEHEGFHYNSHLSINRRNFGSHLSSRIEEHDSLVSQFVERFQLNHSTTF